MNFFEHQDKARQNTVYLIGLFLLAILATIVLLYVAIVWALYEKLTWQPLLFAIVAVGTIISIGSGSVYKLIQLRAGGKAIAEDLGGKLANTTTDNPEERQLLNIVEEMSIASGIPIPAVYILDREGGINAFAAGFTPNDAVVGVTRGCIEQLDRDELQGVIAHEFSHILNGDMRLNLRLIGILQGLLLIHIMGRKILRHSPRRSSSSKEDKNPLPLIGLAMLIIGFIGFIFGQLIKSAVSRQREFLADASAVQFTRNPDGIGSALRKIGGYPSGSQIEAPNAEEASHLFFGKALASEWAKGLFGNWAYAFSTHPPLEERIARLEGLANRVSSSTPATASVPLPDTDDRVAGLAGTPSPPPPTSSPQIPPSQTPPSPTPPSKASSSPTPPPQTETLSVSPDGVVAGVGTTHPKHLDRVRGFLAQLPPVVRTATRNPNGAMAIIYGLLLDSKPEVSNRQLKYLQQSESPEVLELIRTLLPHLRRLDARTRLPLIDLAVPALRQASPQQCTGLLKQVKTLAKADDRLTLSEYAVFLVLRQRLGGYFFAKPQQKTVQFTQMKQIFPDCITVLSALAAVGHDSPDEIAYALRSGLFRLPGITGQTVLNQPVEYTLTQVGESLLRLELATPKLKQAVVDACAYTVLVDRKVTLEEAELLRAIVISLNCPIPPFLDAPKI